MEMREIKFRVWNENLRVKGSNEFMDYSGDNLKDFFSRYPNRTMIVHDGGAKRHLMQFTGFTDKNGKEIYDGDRLSLRVPDVVWGNWDIVMNVAWYHGCWICKEIDFDYSDAKFPEEFTFLYEVANECEIIEK